MLGTTYNFRMSDTVMNFFNVNNVATSPYESDIIIFVNQLMSEIVIIFYIVIIVISVNNHFIKHMYTYGRFILTYGKNHNSIVK